MVYTKVEKQILRMVLNEKNLQKKTKLFFKLHQKRAKQVFLALPFKIL
jgi:hypothetical protein